MKGWAAAVRCSGMDGNRDRIRCNSNPGGRGEEAFEVWPWVQGRVIGYAHAAVMNLIREVGLVRNLIFRERAVQWNTTQRRLQDALLINHVVSS